MGRRRNTDRHLPQRVYRKHGAFYFVDAQNTWHRLGTSVGEMYRALAVLIDEDPKIETVADLCKRYQAEVLSTYSEREQKTRAPHLERIRAVFGEMAPREITARHVRMFRDKVGRRIGLEWMRPQLAKKALSVLSHLFSVAAEWNIIESNPCSGVSRPPQPKRDRYPTDEEFQAVRQCAPAMLQFAMDIALLTGLRREDILSLDRDCVTDDGLLVKTSKTGRSLLFQWTPSLLAAVNGALREPPRVRRIIICTRNGRRYTADGFSTIWRRARKKAIDNGSLRQSFRFNDIRAKSASDDESVQKASERLGHTSRQTTEHFYIRTPRKVHPLR